MAETESAKSFTFADSLVLDESPTRDFYRAILQGLVHKNNNVLGVVQGFSSLILMDEGISQSVRENVEQMRDASQDASELAKVILIAAGCARVQLDRLDLPEFLPYVERTAREICENHGVPLQVRISPDLPPVRADSNRLSELISELIKNAAESAGTVPAGEVAIDVLPPGEASPTENNRVDFFIRNSSETISEEDVVRVFDPFFGSRGGNHIGLGLTAAGVLAGQMGMKLGLRNGDGTTTAWLSLPVDQ